jgi:hypothetical protein
MGKKKEKKNLTLKSTKKNESTAALDVFLTFGRKFGAESP